jgi:hypothetical protein
MDTQSNQSLVDVSHEKSVLPLAPESFKLSSWDTAVFASDILETQVKNKNFEQTAKAMSVAYGKIMMRLGSSLANVNLYPDKLH